MWLDPGLRQCDQKVGFFSFFLSISGLSPKYPLHSQISLLKYERVPAVSRAPLFLPSVRKGKLSWGPLTEEGGLCFPEDSENLSYWIIHQSLSQSGVRESNQAHSWGWGQSYPPTRTEQRKGDLLTGSPEKWEMDPKK